MRPWIHALYAAALLLPVSCGPGHNRDVSDLIGISTGDSLLYYYAQMRAHEYWHEADNDTLMRSPEQRRLFLDGLKAGMDAIKKNAGDENYNRGVRLGARMAVKLLEFEQLYDTDLDEDLLFDSFAKGLEDNSDIPELEYQHMFYALLGRMKSQMHVRDTEHSRITLIEEAREHHLAKLEDNLYFRIDRKGTGPYAANGQSIYVSISFRRAHGDELDIPSPGLVTVGAPGTPEVLNKAYTRLNKGATGMFATTAESIFASRTEILGLRASDVIIMTITLNDIISGPETSYPAQTGEEHTPD